MLELLFSKAGAWLCGGAGVFFFILYIRNKWKKEARAEERSKITQEVQKEDEKLENIANDMYSRIKR